MTKKNQTRSLVLGGAAFLAGGLVLTPIQLTAHGIEIDAAFAAHGTTPDGNNGHGNNRNDDGEKADDVSNPAYEKRERDGQVEDKTDGNSGFGDDKKRDDASRKR